MRAGVARDKERLKITRDKQNQQQQQTQIYIMIKRLSTDATTIGKEDGHGGE